MSDCLFCKIASGDIPCDKVFESDTLLGFRDISPVAPSHLLVIPKQHVANLDAADDAALLGEVLIAAVEVARTEGIADGGYRVVFNVNSNGGQTVAHLHAHILGGRGMGWPPG